MNSGYVRLHRQVLDAAVFQDGELLRLYVLLLLRAAFKEQHVSLNVGRGSTIVKLEPGQAIVGRKATAKELKWPPSTFRNRLQKLEQLGVITSKPDTHYTIVSVVNYGEYQPIDDEDRTSKGQAKDKLRTSKGQAKDTNKNSKTSEKEKNSKKEEGGGEVLMTFPTKDGEWGLTKELADELRQRFPRKDRKAECEKALDWVEEDPEHLKTSAGMKRFLVGWLGRSDDKQPVERMRTSKELIEETERAKEFRRKKYEAERLAKEEADR